MTESVDAPASEAPTKRRGGGLNSMLLADLKAMAGGMGIAGTGSMKKAQLIDAIKAAQAGAKERPADAAPKTDRVAEQQPGSKPDRGPEDKPADRSGDGPGRPERSARTPKGDGAAQPDAAGQGRGGKPQGGQDNKQDNKQQGGQDGKQDGRKQSEDTQPENKQGRNAEKQGGNRQQQDNKQDNKQDKAENQGNQGNQNDADDQDDDGEGGSRRNRRRRGRDRNRTSREQEHEVREDDVLVPAAGILDVLDNYAFVRTSGYLAGTDDVYLSLSLVRKYGLRRGDAVAGQVRQPREGERREKFNPMVRIDSVNGVDPEQAKTRPDFAELTPTHPTERLRMETGSDNVTGRLLDLAAPVGKGQRGLITGAPKSGRTSLLRSIAASITANAPTAHLMVVLIDERPEEVTDFQRSIKGEVVASTFDRPAADHVTAAELAVERAKRLVELGHDVVVLFDGLTRLGRAYNLAGAGSGRVAAGGVDAAALYGLKRFFGAARNIEDGGSLTIVATAVKDSGSATDQLLFEEIDGTENLEIRLRRDLADERSHPALDVVASSTRHADLLLSEEESQILDKLDAGLAELSAADAHRSLIERLGRTRSNIEFLMQVQRD